MKYKIKKIKSSRMFESMIMIIQAYYHTRHFREQYDDYTQWFWRKQVPNLFHSNRKMYYAKSGYELLGFITVKNDGEERKICTWYVLPQYRKLGIGTALLKKGMNWLDTWGPLITIPHYKVKEYENFIKKYSWKYTDTINIYTDKEYVYNGKDRH